MDTLGRGGGVLLFVYIYTGFDSNIYAAHDTQLSGSAPSVL